VNQRMAREFGGEAHRTREHARRALERILDLEVKDLKVSPLKTGVSTSSWSPLEKAAFDNFALVLAQDPTLRSWTRQEKADLLRIIRAKTRPDEMLYLHLTQRHRRLREALLNIGS